MSLADRLEARGFTWAPQPHQNPTHPILAAVRQGDVVCTSGQIPMEGDTPLIGKVSMGNIVEARRAAELCAVACLNAAGSVVGPDDIVGVIKLTVFVNGDRLFEQPTMIANAASDLLIELFGEAGRHARSAVCVGTPLGALVEIEATFRVR